jgi:hypothetical protein
MRAVFASLAKSPRSRPANAPISLGGGHRAGDNRSDRTRGLEVAPAENSSRSETAHWSDISDQHLEYLQVICHGDSRHTFNSSLGSDMKRTRQPTRPTRAMSLAPKRLNQNGCCTQRGRMRRHQRQSAPLLPSVSSRKYPGRRLPSPRLQRNPCRRTNARRTDHDRAPWARDHH